VLLHGLLMDATVWDEVVAELSPEFRRRTRMKLDCRRMRYYGIAVGVVVSIAWAIVVWVWLS
jgi:hypothetical protein